MVLLVPVVSDVSRVEVELPEVPALSVAHMVVEVIDVVVHAEMLANREKVTQLIALMRVAEETEDHHADSSDATSVVSCVL